MARREAEFTEPAFDLPEQKAPEAGSAPEEADEGQTTGRRMDPELRTLSAIIRLLDDLSDEGRERVVIYLGSRYTVG